MSKVYKRKYHIFYKTTCLVTNKFYYGIHSTDDLNDGYLGSGRRIYRSIKKHGAKNHRREILEYFATRKDLSNKEVEIVNSDLLEDPMCLNLKHGGDDGILSEESRKQLGKSVKKMWKRLKAAGYVPPPQSPETIAKRAAKNTGKKRTPEQKLNAQRAQRKAQKRLAKDVQYKTELSSKIKVGQAAMSEDAVALMRKRQSDAAIAERPNRSAESYEKMAAKNRGRKRSPETGPKIAAAHKAKTVTILVPKKKQARTWTIVAENGDVFDVENLKTFCIEKNIPQSRMYKSLLNRKFVAGYRAISVRNTEYVKPISVWKTNPILKAA